ncbi:helicase HerA-like domain-containing protein [Agrococcus sp. GCM10030265]|uniref:helicase HerA-like domain-containing protein n=1 Tax=Agrococcus sp. GCM10030265 TaxID=3273378 RepID=UPI0036205F5D
MSDELAAARKAVEDARRAQADAEERLRAMEEAASARVAEPPAAQEPAPPAAQEPAPPAAPAPEPPAAEDAAVASGPLSTEAVATVRAGYAFEGRALELGVLVNGAADPSTPIRIPLGMLNRHGLVAGATGTGKTRTLQVLVEQLSAAGVPVFAADVKGDLSGIAVPGAPSPRLLERTAGIGQEWQPLAAPVELYSLGGEGIGVPIRATVTGFGPTMLAKVLGLNATQESSLGLLFAYADRQGLPLLDLKDLRELLLWLTSDEGRAELRELGGISPQTAGVILRELTTFAEQGAEQFFGEPEIDVAELLRTAADGRGLVSLLEVPGVADRPQLFSTFLIWLLAELFETLPEVGDLEQPRLVFLFDEAHLLFADASKAFLAAVTQTVRLIRSKGVGIVFVTQTPKDVPSDVLAQLGSRVQHQLRAHTPDAEQALRATVRTYPRSEYDLQQVLTSLGTGEAIVTVMDEDGVPTPVAWTRLRAPQGSMDPMPEAQMRAAVAASPLQARYGTPVDRESAYEILATRLAAAEAEAERAAAEAAATKAAKERDAAAAREAREREAEARRLEREAARGRRDSERAARDNPVVQAIRSRTGQTVIREIVRGILGTRRR